MRILLALMVLTLGCGKSVSEVQGELKIKCIELESSCLENCRFNHLPADSVLDCIRECEKNRDSCFDRVENP